MDPHYFEEDVDLDILGEAFKFALKIAETEPFRDLIQYRVLPPLEADLSTDEKIKGIPVVVSSLPTADRSSQSGLAEASTRHSVSYAPFR